MKHHNVVASVLQIAIGCMVICVDDKIWKLGWSLVSVGVFTQWSVSFLIGLMMTKHVTKVAVTLLLTSSLATAQIGPPHLVTTYVDPVQPDPYADFFGKDGRGEFTQVGVIAPAIAAGVMIGIGGWIVFRVISCIQDIRIRRMTNHIDGEEGLFAPRELPELFITQEPDGVYVSAPAGVLESTTNLIDWIPIATNSWRTDFIAEPNKFYRTKL